MKIACVLVLYNPDIHLLNDVLSSVCSQVDLVCIVDNSSCILNREMLSIHKNIHYIFMNGNKGIAKAQNEGVIFLMNNGYTHILFIDQDSILPRNLVSGLCDNLTILQSEGVKVASIGPRAINRQSNSIYKGNVSEKMRYSENLTETDALLSSGSLILSSNFKIVGLMDVDLFIDGVDHEWCWRAFAKENLRSFIVENLHINHQRGEGDRLFLTKKVAISTPFRIYYQYRNYFILCRRNYVPFKWKVKNGIKYAIKIVYYPLLISPRISYIRNIYNGIFNGLFYK